jgi:hypothetical protein
MTDIDAEAAVIRIERAEEGRWDLTLLTASGIAIGHGVHLFDESQDDPQDEISAARAFAQEHGFEFAADEIHEDGPDAFWVRIVSATDPAV